MRQWLDAIRPEAIASWRICSPSCGHEDDDVACSGDKYRQKQADHRD